MVTRISASLALLPYHCINFLKFDNKFVNFKYKFNAIRIKFLKYKPFFWEILAHKIYEAKIQNIYDLYHTYMQLPNYTFRSRVIEGEGGRANLTPPRHRCPSLILNTFKHRPN